jgi:type II secretory ATPase GspE/PulE/Tfp pilus assembly ATPase PilB-like protein
MDSLKFKKVDLSSIVIPNDVLKLVPLGIMQKYSFVPFDIQNDKLSIVLENPGDINTTDNIRVITGYDLDLFADTKESIENTLRKLTSAFDEDIQNNELVFANIAASGIAGEEDQGTEQPAVVKLVDKLISLAVAKRASDIHLEPQQDGLFVRFRVDGILVTVHKFPKPIQSPLLSRIKILACMDITERRLPQDGQISLEVNHRNIDLRISTLPGKYGEKTVIRVLDKTGFSLDLSQLGFDPIMQSTFETIIQQPQGMLLVTGPTGSGKTTTLYSAINKLRSPLKNVITLEDPIEYELLAGKSNEAGITQVQINTKIGMTFSAALRAALRQDPDIIMVGEIRDKDTAEIAMKASLTGHLVLSTLHTNDSFGTLVRLKDMGIELYLISATVAGILAQRLVRVLCPHCKEAYKPPARALKLLLGSNPNKETAQKDLMLYRAKGCDKCQFMGYRGRRGIYELLVITDELKTIINSGINSEILKQNPQINKMKSLRDSGFDLVAQGITTIEEIFRVTVE